MTNPDECVFAEDLAPTQLSVYPEGQPAAFHTQNDPRQPYQRDNIIERKGRVDVRCEHKDIIHGYFSNESGEPCSLIVLEFRFSPNGVARRIREARVFIKFAALSPQRGEPDPEVAAIYPDGTFRVEPTQQHETVAQGGGIRLTGGVTGAEIGGELKTEKTSERDVSGATTVKGSIDLRGRNWGEKNSASWTLLENATAKTGVVTSMQAANLLKRGDLEHFKATITIKITADVWTEVGSVFRTDPKDDDVWYDPHREPTNRLQKYNSDELGMFNLKSVCDVTYQTILKDTTKER